MTSDHTLSERQRESVMSFLRSSAPEFDRRIAETRFGIDRGGQPRTLAETIEIVECERTDVRRVEAEIADRGLWDDIRPEPT